MLLDSVFQVSCCVLHVMVKSVWDAAVAWDGFIEGLENRQ